MKSNSSDLTTVSVGVNEDLYCVCFFFFGFSSVCGGGVVISVALGLSSRPLLKLRLPQFIQVK